MSDKKRNGYEGSIPNGGSYKSAGNFVKNPGKYAGKELGTGKLSPGGSKAIPSQKTSK
jgi:hypothetical protein